MQTLLYGLAVVACPVGMGVMMWLMMRGRRQGAGDSGGQQQQQVAELRAEIERLKADHSEQHAQGGR